MMLKYDDYVKHCGSMWDGRGVGADDYHNHYHHYYHYIIIIMIIIAMMKKLNIAEAGGSGCGGAEAGPAMRSRTAHPAMQAKNFMGCHQDLEFGVAKDEDKCSSGFELSVFPRCPLIMRSQRVVLRTE